MGKYERITVNLRERIKKEVTLIFIVRLRERVVMKLQLNEAVSRRILELLRERNMTQYQLFKRTGLPRSTISSIIKCFHPSVKLRIIHEICQGFDIGIAEFFDSPLFDEDNLEP